MLRLVAPLAGAWIEIILSDGIFVMILVAPLAGAWIEIELTADGQKHDKGRSPRGSVD